MTRAAHPIETLTDREREVLRLVAEGKTNPQVAETLGIRFETAKWYVSEVISKLGVASREEAAAEWRRYHRPAARLQRGVAILAGARLVQIAAVGTAALAAGAIVLALWLARDEASEGSAELVVRAAYAQGFPSFLEPQQIIVVQGPLYEPQPVGHSAYYSGFRWSSDGRTLAAVELSDPGVLLHIIDIESGADRLIQFQPGVTGAVQVQLRPADQVDSANDSFVVPVHSLQWSPDSRWLAVVETTRVTLWARDTNDAVAVALPAVGPANSSSRGSLAWNLASMRFALLVNQQILVGLVNGERRLLDPAADLGSGGYGLLGWLNDSTLAVYQDVGGFKAASLDLDDPSATWREIPYEPAPWPQQEDTQRAQAFAGRTESPSVGPTADGGGWAYYFAEIGENGGRLVALVVEHDGLLEEVPIIGPVEVAPRIPADVVLVPAP